MRVKRNEQGWLDQLVFFLNYRFDAIPKEDNDSLESLFDSTGPFVAGCDLNHAGDKEKHLKEKLIRDLGFVGEKLDGKVLGYHLNALVYHINKLNLKTEWIVVSGEQYLYPKDHLPREQWPSNYNPLRPKDHHRKPNLAHKQIGTGRKLLKIQQDKFFVARLPWLKGDSLEERLYGIILLALQDGSFSALKRCPSCKKFLIAKDSKRMFCRDDCKINFFNKQHTDEGYFKKWQADKRREQKRQIEEGKSRDKERMEARKFDVFLKKASSRSGSGEHMEVAGFIKRKILGRWNTVTPWRQARKNGKSAIQIWEGLSDQIKNLFRKYWKEQTSLGV